MAEQLALELERLCAALTGDQVRAPKTNKTSISKSCIFIFPLSAYHNPIFDYAHLGIVC